MSSFSKDSTFLSDSKDSISFSISSSISKLLLLHPPPTGLEPSSLWPQPGTLPLYQFCQLMNLKIFHKYKQSFRYFDSTSKILFNSYFFVPFFLFTQWKFPFLLSKTFIFQRVSEMDSRKKINFVKFPFFNQNIIMVLKCFKMNFKLNFFIRFVYLQNYFNLRKD